MSGDTVRRLVEIIERSLRGAANEDELNELAAWRAAALENEQQYRAIERLIAESWTLRPRSTIPPAPGAAAIVARADRLRKGSLPRRLRRWAAVTLAAAGLALAFRFFVLHEPAWAPAEIMTGAHELATVKLADGSVVRLAPSSRLFVRQDRPREVTLEGRAFFAVTHTGEPFRVHTGQATANVLGTRFELASSGEGVRLAVIEGRVALATTANEVVVNAGQETGVEQGQVQPPVPLSPERRPLEWLGRFMAFQATPLGDAAREIERLYNVRVLVADSALARTTLTATFTDQTIEQVMAVVCAVVNAQCPVAGDTITIRR